MNSYRIFVGVGMVLVGVVLAGCQTTAPDETSVPPEPGVYAFSPARFHASIQAGEARYPNLFSDESYAVWVTDEVTQMKLEEEVAQGATISPDIQAVSEIAQESFIVIELHIKSTFPDASIAYDSVGLRSIDLYLVTPDGRRVSPIQRVMNAHSDEEPVDALRSFERSTIVIFPKNDVISGAASIEEGAHNARVVLEGFNSTFFFEWPATKKVLETSAEGEDMWTLEPGERPSLRDVRDATRIGFSKLYGQLRRLMRLID